VSPKIYNLLTQSPVAVIHPRTSGSSFGTKTLSCRNTRLANMFFFQATTHDRHRFQVQLSLRTGFLTLGPRRRCSSARRSSSLDSCQHLRVIYHRSLRISLSIVVRDGELEESDVFPFGSECFAPLAQIRAVGVVLPTAKWALPSISWQMLSLFSS
jgi:hypothetical protein